jgi:MoxR-like ATPase
VNRNSCQPPVRKFAVVRCTGENGCGVPAYEHNPDSSARTFQFNTHSFKFNGLTLLNCHFFATTRAQRQKSFKLLSAAPIPSVQKYRSAQRAITGRRLPTLMISQQRLTSTDQHLHAVLAQLDDIVIGKPMQVKLALAAMLAGGHLLVEDLPGVGKTTLARALACTLGLDWTRIQFTSDLLPSDITGLSIYDVKDQQFRLHRGPVFTSLVLADEINRAPPKAQGALLEAMEEQQVTIDGISHQLPNPFFVVATQNPQEQLGVYPLPESQLDRFIACIELGYPDASAERTLLEHGDRRALFETLDAVAGAEHITFWQACSGQIFTAAPVLDYVQNLLTQSRAMALDGACANGLSPRAGLGLLAMARAWALLHGREMVIPEDIHSIFPSVAAHRLAGSLRQGQSLTHDLLNTVAVA